MPAASSRRYVQCQVCRADHHEDKDDDKPSISFPPGAASGHFPFAMLQSEPISHVRAACRAILDFGAQKQRRAGSGSTFILAGAGHREIELDTNENNYRQLRQRRESYRIA